MFGIAELDSRIDKIRDFVLDVHSYTQKLRSYVDDVETQVKGAQVLSEAIRSELVDLGAHFIDLKRETYQLKDEINNLKCKLELQEIFYNLPEYRIRRVDYSLETPRQLKEAGYVLEGTISGGAEVWAKHRNLEINPQDASKQG